MPLEAAEESCVINNDLLYESEKNRDDDGSLRRLAENNKEHGGTENCHGGRL